MGPPDDAEAILAQRQLIARPQRSAFKRGSHSPMLGYVRDLSVLISPLHPISDVAAHLFRRESQLILRYYAQTISAVTAVAFVFVIGRPFDVRAFG